MVRQGAEVRSGRKATDGAKQGNVRSVERSGLIYAYAEAAAVTLLGATPNFRW